jgi:hypothetical protein
MKLKTLGLTAMALAGVGFPMAARAQVQTYYHAGVWDAFSGRNDRGGAVCGVGNTNPSDNRRLAIRFDIGGTDTMFSVSKPDWSVPDNTHVTVVMQLGLNPPWTEQATGHGKSIDWSADENAMQPFDPQFRGSTSMTLTFPDGNEPPWTISLAGSSAISATFGRCVRDLTRQVQAAAANGAAPAAQPAAPGPTQPFSGSGAAPAVDAPAAATQPDGTQPGATQPGATQPGATQPAR